MLCLFVCIMLKNSDVKYMYLNTAFLKPGLDPNYMQQDSLCSGIANSILRSVIFL